MSNYSGIRVEIHGSVAEVILANADGLNVMPRAFFDGLAEVFAEVDRTEDVRCVVLWAEGRLFTAGLDLKSAMRDLLAPQVEKNASLAARNKALYGTIRQLQQSISAVASCRKPVIAAIHGKCIGGGVDLVTACDIRYCTADASFSVYETKLAIVADLGTLQRLTPIVGRGMAREMAFSGRFVDASRAHQCGLVNQICDDKETLLAEARALAQEIAGNSPLAVEGTKAVMNYSDEHNTADGLQYVAQWNASFLQSNDLSEAVGAFMQKRTPDFRGD